MAVLRATRAAGWTVHLRDVQLVSSAHPPLTMLETMVSVSVTLRLRPFVAGLLAVEHLGVVLCRMAVVQIIPLDQSLVVAQNTVSLNKGVITVSRAMCGSRLTLQIAKFPSQFPSVTHPLKKSALNVWLVNVSQGPCLSETLPCVLGVLGSTDIAV